MHIVLIDPSKVIRRSIGDMLTAGGHKVDAFADSREALDHVLREPSVTCVLTSVEVSPIGGLELCWQLRVIADARRPLSILVMSSAHASRNFGEVLDSGADDFISKPPSRDELFARLRAAERVIGLQRDLIRQADTDSLTRLLNRGAFLREAEAALERGRAGGALTVLLVDIDHFKKINDRHGHAVGDVAIRSVADVLRQTGALSGRLGGEEFALLLEGHGVIAAATVAQRVRARCAALQVPAEDPAGVRFTVSIGLAEWAGDTLDTLLRRADDALYAAKAAGRNRVSVACGAGTGTLGDEKLGAETVG